MGGMAIAKEPYVKELSICPFLNNQQQINRSGKRATTNFLNCKS